LLCQSVNALLLSTKLVFALDPEMS
jgi:hypothetical protein